MPSQRTLNQEWRAQNDATRYPFAVGATLTSEDGRALVEGTFLDAVVHAVGGREGAYLSRVSITHQSATLWVGDAASTARCSGTFPLIRPPDLVALADEYGRPAGLLVSESRRLGIFQSWGVGEHTFARRASEFCATCCVPTPEAGVRGIMLPDGEVLTGDVWLVGEDGVVLRASAETVNGRPTTVIRIDVVGDPLFRRRLCSPDDLFVTPRFVKTLRVLHSGGSFDCTPDEYGNVRIAEDNGSTSDTVIRVRTTTSGLSVGMAGAGAD